MKPLPQATLKPQGKVIEKEKSHSGIFLGDKCYWNPASLRNGHAVVLAHIPHPNCHRGKLLIKNRERRIKTDI